MYHKLLTCYISASNPLPVNHNPITTVKKVTFPWRPPWHCCPLQYSPPHESQPPTFSPADYHNKRINDLQCYCLATVLATDSRTSRRSTCSLLVRSSDSWWSLRSSIRSSGNNHDLSPSSSRPLRTYRKLRPARVMYNGPSLPATHCCRRRRVITKTNKGEKSEIDETLSATGGEEGECRNT